MKTFKTDSAILFTCDSDQVSPELGGRALLLPLHGKPMLQRAMEQFVGMGITRIQVVLDDEAAAVRAFLKDGERWGCRITYHYRGSHASVARLIGALDIPSSGYCWIGDARNVPHQQIELTPRPLATGQPLCWNGDGYIIWSGWGRFSIAWLAAQAKATDLASLARHVIDDLSNLAPVSITAPLSADTPARLIASHNLLLTDLKGTGVVIGQNARIHHDAKLIAPCRIGRNATISEHAVIGPYTSIESGAFVGKGTQISNSVVMQNTYVGADLDVNDAIVHGNVLINAALSTATEVDAPDLLATLTVSKISSEKTLAALLEVCLWPLYRWLRWKLRETISEPVPSVAIPRPSHGLSGPGRTEVRIAPQRALGNNSRHPWGQHFVQTFYPGLWLVVKGELRLIGPALRELREVRTLPIQWRRIYTESACGLLNEDLLYNVQRSSADEQFASDALAAVTPGTYRRIIRFVRDYLRLVLRDMLGRTPSSTTTTHQTDVV